ncbi:tetratricopeptide repeat protein [Candidatus Woesearchaeota archaeon]|nr:tetratricopeptide repeat protein [Candidatus Woesearchaeota archaeon]
MPLEKEVNLKTGSENVEIEIKKQKITRRLQNWFRLVTGKGYKWSNKGVELYNQRKLEEAVECFYRAIEINPKDADTWNNKGTTLGEQGKLEEAIESYDRATEINPEYTTAWNNKGIALNELGKPEEAIKAYERAIELDPSKKVYRQNKKKAQENL